MRIVLVACCALLTQGDRLYQVYPQSDVPYNVLGPRVGHCGTDVGTLCNVTLLASACTQTPGCVAFNTNGFLKSCAGCEFSSDCCIYPQGQPFLGLDDVDLYVSTGNPPPAQWAADIKNGNMLYSQPAPALCYMPEVGNGFLASVVNWNSLHISGLFNGACGTVTKARLPSPLAVNITNADPTQQQMGLDMARGLFVQRFHLQSGVVVEQQIYAHRVRRHVLVVAFSLVQSPNSSVTLNLSSLFDPDCGTAGAACHTDGDGCAGGFTHDFKITRVSGGENGADSASTTFNLTTLLADDSGVHHTVALVTHDIPATLQLSPARPNATFLTAISADIEGTDPFLVASQEFAAALNAAANNTLLLEHAMAWSLLHENRLEVSGNGDRALQVAQQVNSSTYFLYSSIRDDWFLGGLSPGGLATENYQGAVFMDQELYMGAALLWLHPELTAATLQYRAASRDAAAKIASQFGYPGLMFAWTSAFLGHPFGCCSARGGYEDCLEHHVTPDVAFSFRQYYHATGDKIWLQNMLPIVTGIADFVAGRVTNNSDGSYSITKILPIDEWCDDPATGCLRFGITDDLQMNAMSRLALEFAIEAYADLGVVLPHNNTWAVIASNIRLLMNQTTNTHIQFQGFTRDLQPSHYICPEDVLYTTWPMGPYLNISGNVSLNDALLYVPLTCLENAGMTGPIHTVAWLRAGNLSGAHFAFNRSMLAATYGPFRVRNEVDKHTTTVGAHYDNSHFLTGDGGFINAVVAGYMGLEQHFALNLHRPQMPEGVTQLSLVGLFCLQGRLNLWVNMSTLIIAQTAAGIAPLCLTFNSTSLVLSETPVTLAYDAMTFPGVIRICEKIK